MSIHLQKAIGYGISVENFNKFNKTTDSIYEQLYKLNSFKNSDFIIPEDNNFSFIINNDLLTIVEGYNNYRIGKPSELFDIVFDENENISEIIFFPALCYKSQWYRFSNSIDYIELNFLENPNKKIFYKTIIKYLPYGIYPFHTLLMDKDGNNIPYKIPKNIHKSINNYLIEHKDTIFPAVPNEIRWYLTKFNILSKEGINQIRPIYAKWWS